MLRSNPIGTLTRAHFEQPIVVSKTIVGTVAFVSDPAVVRHVLVDNAANYRRDRIQQQMLDFPFGGGLLAAQGDQWRMQRRRIGPAFTSRLIADYAPSVAASARTLVERWAGLSDGYRLDIRREMALAMVAMLERTLFTAGFCHDRDEIVEKAGRLFDLMSKVSVFTVFNLPTWMGRMSQVRLRRMRSFFLDMAAAASRAAERRAADAPTSAPTDLMTVLLQAREQSPAHGLSRKEIAANVLTFLGAGFETSATVLCWALYLLSIDSEWRERVEAEVDQELPGRCYVEASFDRLVATRAAIEEAMRLYPPIPTINRQSISADRLGKQSINPGTIVIVSPWLVHRHRLLWQAPDLFDPSRFLPGAREAIDRFAYLPFGAGPRTCIGAAYALQVLVITLATIVRSFRLDLAPNHRVRVGHRISLHPQGGLPMVLHRR